jgi:hypothetical protein
LSLFAAPPHSTRPAARPPCHRRDVISLLQLPGRLPTPGEVIPPPPPLFRPRARWHIRLSSFTHPRAPLDLHPNPVSASPAFRRSARARISQQNCRQMHLPALKFSDACRLFFAELYQFHSIHLLLQLLSRAIPR